MHDAFNQELLREKMYNLDALTELLRINVLLLNPQQKYVFDTSMKIVNDGTGGIYFWDVPDGKINILLILATIRSHNEIALSSSGILLPHCWKAVESALKSLLNLQSNETLTWNISKNSPIAKI